jgi:AraC family transcriptional regulator
MSLKTRVLASGPGWRVADVVCTSGPHERSFEEQHEAVCISAVTEGVFQYRGTQGMAVLAPGALLLGNHRHCFVCGHEHSTGDRCVSFHFTPQFMESIVASVPGARQLDFTVPSLPPLPELLPIAAAAEAARNEGDGTELEELAMRVAGAVSMLLAGTRKRGHAPSRRDERRIAAALRRIEMQAHEPLSLVDLAHTAAMSPYHFLRTFRAVVGTTPHQFILHTRMRRAAVRLRRTRDSISTIAFDAGFNDLSTFNRRFQRIMALSPSAYRTAARC